MIYGSIRAGAGSGVRGLMVYALIAAWMAMLPGAVAAAQESLAVPDISARGVYAFDPGTGEVILEHNASERLQIGSVTKVATALVVADYLELDDEIVIESSDMIPAGFSAMGLQPGDTLTVEQLLNGLLVVSGGDAAQSMARHIGGEISGSDDPVVAVDAFVEAMNAKVSELGLTDTQFDNPDGDDSEDAWSTAHDVAHLYAALEDNPELARISALTEYSFTSVGPEQTPYTGVTTNLLAGQHDVVSGKTGSTIEAGGCVVLARTIPGGSGTEIVAILGSNLEYDETWTPTLDERWDDATTVMEEIDANWTPGQFIADVPTEAPVADAPVGETRSASQTLTFETTEADDSTGSGGEPLLVVTVAGGVLAFAGVFAWSRVVPHRT